MAAKMYKLKSIEIIPGTPGSAAIPGTDAIAGTPEHIVQTTEIGSVLMPNPLCVDSLDNTPESDIEGLISGVFDPDSGVFGVSEFGNTGGYTTCSPASIWYTSELVTTEVIPATPGTPATTGTPAVPGTPAQFIEHFNEGWNSWARSVDQLPLGAYISYTVNPGSHGVLVTVGTAGREGNHINSFTHGLLVEPGGVKIFENGTITILRYSYTAATEFRLYRQPDNKVVAIVILDNQTLAYVFPINAHSLKNIPIYAYCYLYRGDDTIVGSKIREDNPVQFGAA